MKGVGLVWGSPSPSVEAVLFASSEECLNEKSPPTETYIFSDIWKFRMRVCTENMTSQFAVSKMYYFSFNVSSQFPEWKYRWKGKLGFIQFFLKMISLTVTSKSSLSSLLARIRPFLSLVSRLPSSSTTFPGPTPWMHSLFYSYFSMSGSFGTF